MALPQGLLVLPLWLWCHLSECVWGFFFLSVAIDRGRCERQRAVNLLPPAWGFLSLCAQTLPRSGRPLGDNAKYTPNCPRNLGSRMSYLDGWRGEAMWLRHSSLISEWGTGAGGPRGAPSCWEEQCWERKREREGKAGLCSSAVFVLPAFFWFLSLFSSLPLWPFVFWSSCGNQQGAIMCVSSKVFKATS